MSRLDAAPTPATANRWQTSEVARLRTLLVLAVCLATAGVVALADAATEHEGLSRLDPVIAADVLRLRTPTLTDLAQIFTFLGSEIVVGGLAIIVCAVLLARRHFTRSMTFAIGIGGSAFLTVAVKVLVARPRPGTIDRLGALDTSYSFPSGHTLNTTVFLALAGWLFWPYVRYTGRVFLITAGTVVAVGVALSRVYLGYHWLTDVLASGLVALAWLCTVWLLGSTIIKARADLTVRPRPNSSSPAGRAALRPMTRRVSPAPLRAELPGLGRTDAAVTDIFDLQSKPEQTRANQSKGETTTGAAQVVTCRPLFSTPAACPRPSSTLKAPARIYLPVSDRRSRG